MTKEEKEFVKALKKGLEENEADLNEFKESKRSFDKKIKEILSLL